MKNIIIPLGLILIFLSNALKAQELPDITGSWKGQLDLMGQKLTLVFNISVDENGDYHSSLDSPDQSAYGIEMDETSYDNQELIIKSKSMNLTYTAVLKDENLNGEFKQMMFKSPLILEKTTEIEAPLRPQEPKAPFAYNSEDVIFKNLPEGIKLSGTLTYPKTGKGFPAIILISGSGPQDRNEELFSHKPFWVIADYFTKQGYAVLRYDDRGVGASEGDFQTATSYDLSTDAEAAFNFLKNDDRIDASKIGFMGHSEGGMIAPMIASRNKEVAFLVLLAGPSIKIDSLMALQTKLILESAQIPEKLVEIAVEANKDIYQIVQTDLSDKKALKKIKKTYYNAAKDLTEAQKQMLGYTKQGIEANTSAILSPWFKYFLKFDPKDFIEKTDCPMLAVNGSKDLQVPSKQNLNAFESFNKSNISTKEFENLNHLFQESDTGSPSEYGKIEQTFSEDALKYIVDWLDTIVK